MPFASQPFLACPRVRTFDVLVCVCLPLLSSLYTLYICACSFYAVILVFLACTSAPFLLQMPTLIACHSCFMSVFLLLFTKSENECWTLSWTFPPPDTSPVNCNHILSNLITVDNPLLIHCLCAHCCNSWFLHWYTHEPEGVVK